MTFWQTMLAAVGAFIALIVLWKLIRWALEMWMTHQRKAWYARQKYVLLRLQVPKGDEKSPSKGPIVMEQIFNTLHGIYTKRGFFETIINGASQAKLSFEVAHIDGQIFFYVHTPLKYQKLIEGQLYAQYPEVEIVEVPDFIRSAIEISSLYDEKSKAQNPKSKNFDIALYEGAQEFSRFEKMMNGKVCVAEMKQVECFLWPLKTYDFFVDKEDKTQIDTLSALTSAMSKLNADEDQAWFQMVITPEGRQWQKYGSQAFSILKEGYFNRWGWSVLGFVNWYSFASFWTHWLVKRPVTFFMRIVWTVLGLKNPLEDTGSVVEKQEVGFSKWEVPKRKLSKIGFQTSIRLGYMSRSGDIPSAKIKIEEMASSFNQFSFPEVSGLGIASLGFSHLSGGRELFERIRDRSAEKSVVLSVDELATLYHLPMWSLDTPNVAWVRSKRLEPPAELPMPRDFEDLTVLGKTNFRGASKLFGIKSLDRRRHMYIIGKTGMGKSTVLENMLFDDIQKGRGVAVIDPHGELADKVTAMVPKERINDVIVFDPSDIEHPVSFNMLEVKNPEHRSLVASGLVGVFKKMYAESWGPRLEYILRNCIMALTEFDGATLLGIPRMLVDPIYREKVVNNVKDPVVKAFWTEEFANMSDKLRTEAISPIQNKVGQFLSSPIIRNILGQVKSSIDIRHAMDTGKIFIVNLSKGKIGEDNSSLLGAMLITKFQLDAMSRADMDAEKRKDFYLYVDEFQNFATDSFATILSEARKYKLNLVMANQYVQQMEEDVMYAVFGNVGTLITFQVGFDDAEYFSKQFGEVVLPADIISLPKYTTYTRLLIDNMPSKVFSAAMSPPVDVDMNSTVRRQVLDSSRERYGADKQLVEENIQKWSGQLVAPEMKKALQAKGGTNVRWRYDRNRSEFEDLLKSAGKKFERLERDQFEKFGVTSAVNEYVYHIPEERIIFYSRVDTQGNIFNKKDNKISAMRYKEGDYSTQELVGNVDKEPGWQLGVNKIVGGGFRSPKNQEEMEGAFVKSGCTFEVVERKDFEKFGLEKALNEVVYKLVIKNKESGTEKELIVISALDPQGGCFTRNPDQVIRIGEMEGKIFKDLSVVKKSLEWIKNLEQVLFDM
ncbi:MAG: type IV secretion system DNA-binding domain-containing protein [Candidatus Gracilibacteria bacterium]|nr:type IV secretion system DNA-binding domain-containing protein [Candidatus Gracilibacteria bacterium]